MITMTKAEYAILRAKAQATLCSLGKGQSAEFTVDALPIGAPYRELRVTCTDRANFFFAFAGHSGVNLHNMINTVIGQTEINAV